LPGIQLAIKAVVICLAVVGVVAPGAAEPKTCAVSPTVRDEPPKDPNAAPFGFGDWHVNADRTIWVRSNGWRAGREGNKVIWIRPAGTTLVVTGKRIDARAPALQASQDRGYPTGFTVIDLQFPSAGCWEVEAEAGKSKLDIVVHVAGPQPH